jgi:hypothetical protein
MAQSMFYGVASLGMYLYSPKTLEKRLRTLATPVQKEADWLVVPDGAKEHPPNVVSAVSRIIAALVVDAARE